MTFSIITKQVPTFYFIGVTTSKSSILRIFPHWMQILGRPDVVIEGIDHAIHDHPERYRATVAQIKYDPLSIGALITTHKLDLYSAAADLFAYLDPYASLTKEMTVIAKADQQLAGYAIDPITAGQSLDALIGPDYFGRTGGEVLCFGAGGSALATLLHLINKPNKADRPARFVVVNRSQTRLDQMLAMARQLGSDIEIEAIVNNDPLHNDLLMAHIPDHSIVINATGMGKDTPGSPITDAGVFPQQGLAWEFNYRGELDFLHQALRQREARTLRVEDGWVYFLHGWSQGVAKVLQITLTDELFAQLSTVAAR